MYVTPIAQTIFQPMTAMTAGWSHHDGLTGSSSADELAEFAGRNCYRSFSRPNPKTATNEGYLANILAMGHESVLEHASVTFYVEGVSRALLAELSRHRHLSFSVISQRYVDANKLSTVMPPAIDELDDMDRAAAEAMIDENAHYAIQSYNELVDLFERNGFKRKKAREAARAVLPSSTDSPMVVTGNLRAWRDVLGKRHHVAADAELQEFAFEILGHLQEIAPNSVQDIPEEQYGTE